MADYNVNKNDNVPDWFKEALDKRTQDQLRRSEEMNIKNYWEYNEKQNTHVMEFPFGNHKTYFELDEIAPNSFILNFYQTEHEKLESDKYRDDNPKHFIDGDKYHQANIKNGDINYAKTIVEMTSNKFFNDWYETTINVDPKYINDNLNSTVKLMEREYSQNNLIIENNTNIKTREEVDELKWQFTKVYDWGWNERIFKDNYPDTPFPKADIENTEGFEEYREELKELRLDTLKKHWEADPIWDIETTEGFEEYHDELLDYHKIIKQQWEERRLEEIKNEKIEAEKLGLHGLYSMIKDLNPESNIFSPSYVQNVIDRNNKINQTADKMGFVQGVCECVAALGDDYTLGKKLLTEMNVNKDMAQKFANPETFKKLEQGIFAQKQDQKLEKTQGFKR